MARPPKASVPKENFNKFDRLVSKERSINLFRKELDSLADFYGFSRIYTSPVDNHRFFSPLAKAGLLDDRRLVVCKNKTDDFILLRPSSILSALRAYLTNKLSDLPHPLKLAVDVNSFQTNRKEDGNLVIAPEFSMLMFEETAVVAEAEIFQVIWRSLQGIGFPLGALETKINALGCKECRPIFRSTLSAYLRSRLSRLCKNCKKDLKNNPTTIFSCEEEKCKIVAGNAPPILDFLCEACKKYLRELLEFLDELNIPYLLDAKFFKNKSWYNKIIWEIKAIGSAMPGENEPQIKKEYLLGSGGGISDVFEILSGKPAEVFSGTVFVENLERLAFQEKLVLAKTVSKPRIFLTQLGELAKRKSFGLMEELRKADIMVAETLSKDAIKSQLKSAEVVGAEIALILGQKEALDKTVIVRDIQSGIQETISQDKLVEFLKKKLEN